MTNRYVLIDHENVQPKDLALLGEQALKVIVFVGANQTKISVELTMALQARGADGQYVRMSGNGPNALDMHIAFYLGELAASDPSAQFRVISKDRGYESLIAHLQARGIDVQRAVALTGLFAQDERLTEVIGYLSDMKKARPQRKSTLANAIKNRDKTLPDAEVENLIAALERCGVLSLAGAKVTYRFAQAAD
jgi:hypothetical protein